MGYRINIGKISNFLLGDRNRYTMEERMYRAFTLLGIACCFVITIMNLITELYVHALVTITAVLSLSFIYWLSKYKNKFYPFSLLLIMNAVLGIIFFYANGYKGSTPINLVFIYISCLTYIPSRYHIHALVLQIAYGIGLFLCEIYFPSSIHNPYLNDSMYYSDQLFGFNFAMMAGTYFIYFVRRSYEKEKDLNDLQKKEIQEHSNQKTMFFLNIAHEIKTPLTIIRNYLDKYIEKNGTDERLDIIKENIEKMNRDIVHFMNVEKLDQEKDQELLEQNISLSLLAEQKLASFRIYAQKKNIELTAEIIKNIGVIGDLISLEHILNNLLDNAFKYTPEKGSIHVTVFLENKNAVFCIRDNGPGIEADKQKNIFDPFYQASRQKFNAQGIGMGLYIVKRNVEKMKGTISLESIPGKGSTFNVRFPYVRNDDEALSLSDSIVPSVQASVQPATDETTHKAERHTLLLVEDNISLLCLMQEDLSSSYNVYTAVNGKNALEKLKRIPDPDLILSDIMMDEMDGYAFYHEIRNHAEWSSIPFVFLSAKSDVASRLEGLQMGALDYMPKPFVMKELSLKIASILQHRARILESVKQDATQQILTSLSKASTGKELTPLDVLLARHGITPREKEVFSLLEKGLKYEDIAGKLFISERTVVRHVQNMYAKTGAGSRQDLIRIVHHAN